jgi:hypothetical protein
MKGKLTIIIVWLLTLLPVLVSAQTYYFNNRYELTTYQSWDFASSIIQSPEKFVIYGESGGNFGWRTIVLKQLDLNGIEAGITMIGDTLSEWSIGYPGSLLKSPNGTYFSTGFHRNYTTNWVHDRGLLCKFDENFDTLWTKEYGEKTAPFDTAYIFRNLCFSGNNSIAMTGSFLNESGNTDAHAYLIKTDTSGNKLWEHVYTNLPGDVQGYSVVSTTDGGYAIGAFQYYHVPPPNETGDPIVIKTDSLGNFEWVRNLGGELMDTHAMVANSADGNILVISAYSDSVSGGDEWAKKIHLVKLTNDNQVIFDRKYNRKIYMLFTHTVHCNPDGTIICSGSTGTKLSDYPFTVGWLMKMDSNGDSLWYREYQKVGRPNSFSSNVLYNVIPTSDNGYIACGYVHPVLPDTGTQDVWVVKVDSMGCESPSYCWVGVKELPIAPRPGELIVYPNPADEVFTIIFQSPIQKGILQFVDMMGCKTEEICISPGQTTMVISCTNWPPGLYLGQVLSEGRIISSCKVIVK